MKRTMIAFLLASLVPAAAQAAQVAMAPVQCTNLLPGECAAVGAVFASAFTNASGIQVAPPPELAAPVTNGIVSAPAATPPLPAAAEYLNVSAVRLASRISLRAVLNRNDGALIHAVDMTATSLDDLPPAAERMSRALITRVSVDQTMTLRNITKTEGARANRTTTERVMGMKTGMIMPFAKGADLDPMLSFQFDGRFESERYFLEFGAGVAIPSDTNDRSGYGGLFAEFGASAYLGGEGSPLYLGGGVSPRIFGGNSGGGVQGAAYGQIGLMFMRTSSTRLYAEFRTSQNLIPMKVGGSDSSSYPYNPQVQRVEPVEVYPTEFALQVGIGW